MRRNTGPRRRELSGCSFCDGNAFIQFKPCLHRVSCPGCCSSWTKCVCGAEIQEKFDVTEDPCAFDEAVKSKDPFVRELLECKKENVILTNDKIILENDNATLKNDNVFLRNENASLQSDNVNLKSENSSLKGANGTLVEVHSADCVEIARLEDRNSNLSEDLRKGNQQINRLFKTIKSESFKSKLKTLALRHLKRGNRKLTEEKQALIQDQRCAVCLDAPKSYVFASCGHCACSDCQKNLKTCHVCRKRIRNRVKLF